MKIEKTTILVEKSKQHEIILMISKLLQFEIQTQQGIMSKKEAILFQHQVIQLQQEIMSKKEAILILNQEIQFEIQRQLNPMKAYEITLQVTIEILDQP